VVIMKAFFSFFIGQKVLVNLLFALAMVVGLIALFALPVERYPNVHMGKAEVTTILPGASPDEIETLITRKIEDALDDLDEVEFIQSASYRERSVITVKFIDDTDYGTLFDRLQLKVLSIIKDLPAGIEPPIFNEIRIAEWLPAVSVNLIGDRGNRALSLMAEEMKLELRAIAGVREVQLHGELVREFHVLLDLGLLNKYGLTFDDVAAALIQANLSIPAGTYENEAGEFVLVADERFRTREQVGAVIIRRDGDGSFVTVADVWSDAHMAYRNPYVITSVNGKDCVTLKVIKTDQGNVLDIVPAVEAVLERHRLALAKENVEPVLTQDQRVYVYDSIRTLGWNLAAGVILVSVLIYLFMGVRAAVLTVVGIPFSFLMTMTILWVMGKSLNEITLFALVLASGMIVDDAIVTLENMYRHLQLGASLRDAAVQGAAEVAAPVLASTATTIAAFLPMLIMTGSTGEFFAQIPIGITAALCASLFECLLILPPHFVDWPAKEALARTARGGQPIEQERRIMVWIRRLNQPLIRLTMRFRITSLVLVLAAFLAALAVLGVSASGLWPIIKIKFFPEEYNYYYIEIEGPPGTPIHTTHEKLKQITSGILPGRPGQLRAATGIAGLYLDENYEPVFGDHVGHINVEMPDKKAMALPDNPDHDPIRHLAFMRRELAPVAVDGWKVRVRAEKGGPPAGKDLSVRVVGPDPRMVQALADEMHRFLRTDSQVAPDLADLSDNRGVPNRVYRFRVDRERAAEYGLTPSAVTRLAASVLDGRYNGEFRTLDEDIDLKLMIDPRTYRDPGDALAVASIQHPSGPIRLGDLMRTEVYTEPSRLDRYQNHRAITLTANLKPDARTSTPSVVQRVRAHYDAIASAYPGAGVNFSGEFETTRRSYTSLAYAFLIALLAIYMILATQFRSYLQPLIILSAVVFALIGVVFGKVVSRGLFTVNSFIAVVGVTGVVVNDSLVLIDFINRGYSQGKSRRQAIEEGVQTRLWPILLTTLTTVLGLAPMALGFPSYSLVWGSMASTFVTGLCTATFLTLFIVPVEWDLLMGLKLRIEKRRAKRRRY